MFNERIVNALNKQLNFEFYSSYLYLSMSAYYTSAGLKGFANWMQIQAQEELVHAMGFYNFINERGGRVDLAQIDNPKKEWSSPLEAFEEALAHEILISKEINELINIALEEKDHATSNFLQWYIKEQVEEESTASDIVQKLKLTDGVGGGLFMIDTELATRVFIAPIIP